MNVHPAIAPILTNFRASVTDVQLAGYKTMLKQHDWEFEYSDDYHFVLRGRQEREDLESARRQLDPDFSIWNEYCPAHHRRHLRT